MQFINTKTSEVITVMNHIGDYVHTRNTGNEVLDEEDVIKINNYGWNFNGIVNKAKGKNRISGVRISNKNVRGVNADTHTSRQSYDYFKLDGGE